MLLGNAVFVFSMFIYWRTRKVYTGYGFWTAANMFLWVGLLLLSLRGYVSDFLSVIIANTFLMLTSWLTFAGIRKFWGRPYHDKLNYALTIFLILGFLYFLYVRNDINARILIYSFCSGIVYLKCAASLLRDVPEELRPSSSYAAGIFLFVFLSDVTRSIFVLLNPLPTDSFASDPALALFFVGSTLVTIAWIVSIFMLTSQRVELELHSVEMELRRLATIDFLTGIYNRRSFFDLGEKEVNRARRYDRSLAILLLDIDHFKEVNDTLGHAAGDELLKTLALVCQANLRDTDILARLGGEEFAILLPEANRESSLHVAEKLRLAISELQIAQGDAFAKVTVSIGLAMLHTDDRNMDSVLRRADAALYEAKHNGRNRVAVESLGQ